MGAGGAPDTGPGFNQGQPGTPEADDGAMPAELTVGQAATWIRRSPGGLRRAIARGLLRADQRVSPLQPRPYWVIQAADLLVYETDMAERGAKRGPKPGRGRR
jgi:hypothetical protein